MDAMYLVFATIIIVLWIFIILIAVTPWTGLAIIPYLLIFTFLASAIILGIVWAYQTDSFDGMGWEALMIFILLFASLIVGILVLYYYIRKKINRYAHEVSHHPNEHRKKEHEKHKLFRDPFTNTPMVHKEEVHHHHHKHMDEDVQYTPPKINSITPRMSQSIPQSEGSCGMKREESIVGECPNVDVLQRFEGFKPYETQGMRTSTPQQSYENYLATLKK